MKQLKIFFLLGVLILMTSCSSTKPVKASGVSIAPGTEVPFSKINSQAFAPDYIGKDVIVHCKFFLTGSAGANTSKIPKNHFTFQVTGIDTDDILPVIAPIEYSDLIFSLKTGDKLTLRGGTLVSKIKMGALFGENTQFIDFLASSIKKQ